MLDAHRHWYPRQPSLVPAAAEAFEQPGEPAETLLPPLAAVVAAAAAAATAPSPLYTWFP